MAKSYREIECDQEFLLPPDMQEWLAEGHVVGFLIEATEQMDTTLAVKTMGRSLIEAHMCP
ncbi:hypothetical protein [Brevibacterium jeotgali]|uniref:Transposase n=1 Tax=Brevibacterium jeotgali TaxID=1262550 RepID=A0A2H1L1M5_9MICO|nr:hypothetical protein [Brevibacterium jeotgali]TWC02794.1 hypothetical protein FB108_1496 [Brevibacterium jeotgali]SMY10816.1 hypothetical protein BJEO58_00391 [Brevibacterium jeotgali]